MSTLFRQALTAALGATALAACSLSAEGWIDATIKQTDLSRGEARCAIKGVLGALDEDRVDRLGRAFSNRPNDLGRVAADVLIDQVASQVDAYTVQVLRHYARECRRDG